MKNNVKDVTLQVLTAKTRQFKKGGKVQGRVLDVKYRQITEYDNSKKPSVRVIDSKDENGQLVHNDLTKALKAFVPHFMFASDRANINDFDEKYWKNKDWTRRKTEYEVTGIHIKEVNGHNHVILVGRQNLKNGRVISMVPPMIRYDFDPNNDQEEKYPFYKHLEEAVDKFLTQVEQYLDGYQGEPAQAEIDFDGNPEEDEEKIKKIS
jgi:hypothetical protein